VHCSGRTLQALPFARRGRGAGDRNLCARDQIKLFGFRSDIEREWFRLLQTVQGVGAKVGAGGALYLAASDLANAIALRDKAAVTRTPGVGPKVAERIVTEIEGQGAGVCQCRSGAGASVRRDRRRSAPRPVSDAISALVNLGYGQPQAAAAIASASRSAGEKAETAQLIRLGLKELAK